MEPMQPMDGIEEYDEERLARYVAYKGAIRKACIWSWPVCIVGFGLGFAVIAGFLPPPSEAWSASHIAHFYAKDRTAIRAGIIIAMFFSALLLPFYAVISSEMRKIEGPGAVLAMIQLGGAIVLVTFFQIICLLWLEASFRPENDPQLVRAMNDYGWLVWTILIPTYSLQYICMAVAGFMDFRKDVLWPRWACWANLWVAFLGAGGVLSIFFKRGPFSWEGIIGIWIPVIAFGAGMTMTMVLILMRESRRKAAVSGSPATSSAAGRSPRHAAVPIGTAG
jgi:hypothetical protein